MKPKVAALVSMCNAGKYIVPCMENLTRQTLFINGDLEVLLLDAASPDSEKTLCRDFLERYPDHIRYIRLDKRLTLYETWNFGATMTEASYLTSANVDDIHEDHCLERLALHLDRHAATEMVYGFQRLTKEYFSTFERIPSAHLNLQPRFFAPMALFFNPCGCQPMWRRSLHSKLGGFCEDFEVVGDYDFVLQAAKIGKIGKIERVDDAYGVFLDRGDSLSRIGQKDEMGKILNRHYSIETILDLYRIEGYPSSSSGELRVVLEDFICRCLAFFTVWGGEWISHCNYRLARIAIDRLEPSCAKTWLDILDQLEGCCLPDDRIIQLQSHFFPDVGDNLSLMYPIPKDDLHPPVSLVKRYRSERTTVQMLREIGAGICLEDIRRFVETGGRSRPLYIWGYGGKGRRIQSIVESSGIQVSGFIDRSVEGRKLLESGHWLIAPSELETLNPKPLIMIATGDRREVENHLSLMQYTKGLDFISSY